MRLSDSRFVCGQPECAGDLPDQSELLPVEVAPHEHGDDAGHRVGQEDEQPQHLAAASSTGVEREREEQCEPEHDGHLDQEHQGGAPESGEEAGILERAQVVLERDETHAADEPVDEKAQVARVDERCDEHRREHDEEGEDESVGDEVLLPLDRVGHLELLHSGDGSVGAARGGSPGRPGTATR